MNHKKIKKYAKKRNQIIKLLDELIPDRYYDHRTDSMRDSGYINKEEIAERVMRRFGVNKPKVNEYDLGWK